MHNHSMLALTATIAAAFLGRNKTNPDEVGPLLANIHGALAGLGAEPAAEEPAPIPAYNVRRSVTPEAIYSLLDGKPYKMLKRHLSVQGITPDQYRQRFGLPSSYPMVAPAYSARRAELAKRAGLGHYRKGERKRG